MCGLALAPRHGRSSGQAADFRQRTHLSAAIKGFSARELTPRRPCYSRAPGPKSASFRNSRNGASILILERLPFHPPSRRGLST